MKGNALELSESTLKKIAYTVDGHRVRNLRLHIVKPEKNLVTRKWILGEVLQYDPLKNSSAWIFETWEIDGSHTIIPGFQLDLKRKLDVPVQTGLFQ